MQAVDVRLAPPIAQYRTAGDRYLAFFGYVLLGYALLGRGFAYIGVFPLFIGEISGLLGLAVLLTSQGSGQLFQLNIMRLLALFMAWGAACTLPHITTYGVNALRDAVLWGYGLFAFIVAGLLIYRAERLPWLLRRYQKFAVIFPAFIWLTLILKSYAYLLPTIHDVPLVYPKTGDALAHAGAVGAFMITGMARANPVLVGLLTFTLFLGNRAGMLAAATALLIAASLTTFKARTGRFVFLAALALVFLALTMPTVQLGGKVFSAELAWTKAQSIFTETDASRYNNTKRWRLEWWGTIVGYTFEGPYFWMGKGFGINLSVDDGFKSGAGEDLRSPHNGHMTVLARSGVPGFLLWVLLQGTWLVSMWRHYRQSRVTGELAWAGIFAFLIAYWAAIMVNASFDVVLESPMGGIWAWTVFGVGVAAMHIHKTRPEVIYAPV